MLARLSLELEAAIGGGDRLRRDLRLELCSEEVGNTLFEGAVAGAAPH
jgi:hypothetical protein